MLQRFSKQASRGVLVTLLMALFCLPLIGCGGSGEPEKSPEDVEKARQEHAATVQREMEDG